jgi:alpha-tubulin suppressor-like RCC1 family protein
VTTAGDALCWGNNANGQLGNGSNVESHVPVPVQGSSSSIASIGAGTSFSCAVTKGGAVECWGLNGSGQLGNGGTTDSNVPVQVTGLTSGVASVAVGGAHACAVTMAGTLTCWGSDSQGQLGNNSNVNSSMPISVMGLSGVTAVATGTFHTCALVGGTVFCWGNNQSGEIGNNSMLDVHVPTQVAGLTGIKAISSGADHNCVLNASNGIECWGRNDDGQLGIGSNTNALTPVQLGFTSGCNLIACGGLYSCAYFSGPGTFWCWGSNAAGQLGVNSTTSNNSPKPLTGVSAATQRIAAGFDQTCAVGGTGTLQCWGDDAHGQLGNNSTTNALVPVSVVVP